jgi:hypothetical protein
MTYIWGPHVIAGVQVCECGFGTSIPAFARPNGYDFIPLRSFVVFSKPNPLHLKWVYIRLSRIRYPLPPRQHKVHRSYSDGRARKDAGVHNGGAVC